MKKLSKHLLVLTLTSLISFTSMISTVSASEISKNDTNKTNETSTMNKTKEDDKVKDNDKTNVINTRTIEKDLTEDEYIEKLAEIKKVSLEEAKKIVEKRKIENRIKYGKAEKTENSESKKVEESEINEANGSEIYRQVVFEDDLVNDDNAYCKLSSGFVATIYVYNSFAQVTAVDGVYVDISSNGSLKWNKGNQVAKIVGNGKQVLFTAAGVIDGQVNTGVATSFEKAGFSISMHSDKEHHVRKHCTIEHSFYPNKMN